MASHLKHRINNRTHFLTVTEGSTSSTIRLALEGFSPKELHFSLEILTSIQMHVLSEIKRRQNLARVRRRCKRSEV